MYIIDFFKRITRKTNVAILIYLLLNILIIGFFISFILQVPFSEGLFKGIVLYAGSLVIALSPIGEWILRVMTGCKKIQNIEQMEFIEPIFREVYDKAKKMDSTIPDNVKLYISSDNTPNAFATGRKTICLTKGLLNMPKEEIKATLAHEFGHLAHKDTDLILIVTVGNIIITGTVLAIRFIISVILAISSKDGLSFFLSNLIVNALIVSIIWIWTKIGILLVMKSSRENEYEADKFAVQLGFGNELCMLLDKIGGPNAKGLFANLVSSHPNKGDRIARIRNWM